MGGCVMISAAGGQPLAVALPADNMAAHLTQSARGQFLQPAAMMQSPMDIRAPIAEKLTPAVKGVEAHVQPLAQIQAYSPFNGKKYETLSYLCLLANFDLVQCHNSFQSSFLHF